MSLKLVPDKLESPDAWLPAASALQHGMSRGYGQASTRAIGFRDQRFPSSHFLFVIIVTRIDFLFYRGMEIPSKRGWTNYLT